MPTARKMVVLQPVSKEAVERIDEICFRQAGLMQLGEMGTVLQDTFEFRFIERATIDGYVMPWQYEINGEVIQIPDDFVMARYEAFIIPNEEVA